MKAEHAAMQLLSSIATRRQQAAQQGQAAHHLGLELEGQPEEQQAEAHQNQLHHLLDQPLDQLDQNRLENDLDSAEQQSEELELKMLKF